MPVIRGLIYALDPATAMGFAYAPPGESPVSGTVVLKEAGEHRRVALGNAIDWLNKELQTHRPELVVKEAPLHLGGFKFLHNGHDTVLMAHMLHGIIEGMCVRHGIACVEASVSTIRKHFVGKGKFGERGAAKAAVVKRCHALGYMPRDCFDDDRADALATWDWAAMTYGRRTPQSLVMFGEGA